MKGSLTASGEVRRIRADSATVQDYLEKLDEAASAAESNHELANARETARYRYRAESVVVEVADAGGAWVRYEALPRNISRGGVCLLLGQFVYPKTECRVHLVSLYNHVQAVKGKVVRCRYVPGSGRMHEIGIQFAAPVDVGLFHRGARHVRILIASPDASVRRNAERLLQSSGVDLVFAESGPAAVESASTQSIDVLLFDVETPDKDGSEAVRELRGRGFPGPIVAIIPADDEASRTKWIESGFWQCVAKSLERESLESVMDALHVEPTVSSKLREAKLVGTIDAFVRELPDRIQELETAFLDKDFAALARVAATLKPQAESLGFEAIAAAVGAIEQVCSQQPAPTALRTSLNELLRNLLAARPVSCLAPQPRPSKPAAP